MALYLLSPAKTTWISAIELTCRSLDRCLSPDFNQVVVPNARCHSASKTLTSKVPRIPKELLLPQELGTGTT